MEPSIFPSRKTETSQTSQRMRLSRLSPNPTSRETGEEKKHPIGRISPRHASILGRVRADWSTTVILAGGRLNTTYPCRLVWCSSGKGARPHQVVHHLHHPRKGMRYSGKPSETRLLLFFEATLTLSSHYLMVMEKIPRLWLDVDISATKNAAHTLLVSSTCSPS